MISVVFASSQLRASAFGKMSARATPRQLSSACLASSAKLLTKVATGNSSSQQHRKLVVAIRREDASIWERRAPLAPAHVQKLRKAGVRVLIQPSNRRAYPLQSYVRAGAEAKEDISEAPVILGVKQVPIDLLLENKTYCFFSHTIKAQEANMALLDAVLERNVRLIDYERMVDPADQRVVAFGKYAGVAGMINILHGLGLRLLALGHHTPFMHIGPAHNYRNLGTARQAIRDTGYEIALGKMPRSIGPLTFAFTGSGNVSQGAQQLFNELPVEYVEPHDLREVAEFGSTSKVYGTVVSRGDHLRRCVGSNLSSSSSSSDTSVFDPEEYSQRPDLYRSTFATSIAPFASVIVNGAYWPPNAPRLLTVADAKQLQRSPPTNSLIGTANNPSNNSNSANKHLLDSDTNGLKLGDAHSILQQSVGTPTLPHRLLAICDISADPGGSIEFMQQCTTIDNPFDLYDADTNKSEQSFAGNGFLICSIDNMPTQLPLEATDMFGNLLFPYIMDIVKSDALKPVDEHNYSHAVKSAIIASNGCLQPNYEYIRELREKQLNKSFKVTNGRTGKRVLVLGAGHVSKPLVEYLARDKSVAITVVSKFESDLKPIAERYGKDENTKLRCTVASVDAEPEKIDQLIQDSDLVVSLLPNTLHVNVANMCIDKRVNMITTSYESPEMRELSKPAEEAGIVIMNETGLDPGIDHLLALQAIHAARERGAKIKGFLSYCCGLPTPECADNPLGYKFGWNPKGAFGVTLNGSRYLEDGRIQEIAPGGNLVDSATNIDSFLRGFALESFPNRDSLHYQKLYDLPEAKSVIRKTMRYRGFSETIKVIRQLGLMDLSPHPLLEPSSSVSSISPRLTWRRLLSEMMGHSGDLSVSSLRKIVFEKLDRNERQLEIVTSLGLLSEAPVVKCSTPFDTIRQFLISRYVFNAHDNDLILMRIELELELQDKRYERQGIELVVYGDKSSHGFSAMAKTVGYPSAILSKMILSNEIQQRGVLLPIHPNVYNPVLRKLKDEGISAKSSLF